MRLSEKRDIIKRPLEVKARREKVKKGRNKKNKPLCRYADREESGGGLCRGITGQE